MNKVHYFVLHYETLVKLLEIVCNKVYLIIDSTFTVQLSFFNSISQEKINISACVNVIPYINGAREMGVHERIASVM